MTTLPNPAEKIWDVLVADSGVGSLIGDRIFYQQASVGVGIPYVVFYIASGVMPNETPRGDLDWVFRVEAVANYPGSATAIQDAVFTALHEQALSLAGWTNYRMQCINVLDLPPNATEGVQYFRRVGEYRVRASED